MLPVVFQVGLFEKPQDKKDFEFSHRCLMWMLECLVNCNREYLRLYPNTPDLKNAGVQYTRERGTEDWSGIKVGLRTKKMDCEDLSSWRVAELREKYNEFARPYVKFRNVHGFWHYHIMLMRGDRKRIEDPSKELGMNRDEGKPLSNIRMIRTLDL
jgi:hypothetical protein